MAKLLCIFSTVISLSLPISFKFFKITIFFGSIIVFDLFNFLLNFFLLILALSIELRRLR